MSEAKQGSTVKIHYSGTLDDGTVFDTTVGREPLEFTLGSGQIIPAFERAVEGMTAGEKKTAVIPADEAYGPRQPQAVVQVPAEQLPPDLDPAVGQQLQMQGQDGQAIPVRVTEVTDESVTVDANHPLAGKDLTFAIELVSVS